MHLLTWHGTLVCLRDEGGLSHLPVAGKLTDATPLDLDIPVAPAEPERVRTSLGPLHVSPAHRRRGVWLARFGQFLCAEADRPAVAFSRAGAAVWETFLPITAEDLADLRHLLGHDWIDARTRQVIPRRAIRMAREFRLQVGRVTIELADWLPSGVRTDDAGAYAPPDSFRLAKDCELVLARPRGSVLVATPAWPVRARQTAETVVLAAHRELRGEEPGQADLDRDVAFLMANGGPAALGDVLHRLRQDPAAPPAAEADGAAMRSPAMGAPACPVVSVGAGGAAAAALRRMGAPGLPMPFDWIGATPSMVRHVLETRFEVLLDRSFYASLPGAGDAPTACAHRYYAEHFGVERVFGHSDPTQDDAYRHVQAGVARFGELLASAGPKLFVQVHPRDPDAAASFEATACLLERLTQGGMLLQVMVERPDRRRAVPLLSLTAQRGTHRLYTMQPSSRLESGGFDAALDQDYLAWLIAAHAARPAAAPETLRAERDTLSNALGQFGADRPDADHAALAAGQPITELGNASLDATSRMIGWPDRFRFTPLDRAAAGAGTSAGTVLVDLQADFVTLHVDTQTRDPWMLMFRALSLIYLIDAMLARHEVSGRQFLAELGDAGARDDSTSFCSNRPSALLLPDPDFIRSGGYDEERRLSASQAPAWKDRRPVLFWRGNTTGRQRHPPPAAGEPDDFTWLPRLDLCQRVRRSARPELYDVGISTIVQIDDASVAARIEAADLMRPRAPRTAFMQCRANLVIDGNTNAWSALFCALLGGACVVKVAAEHGFRQWYYDRLTPWVHYVPVAADFSDLEERAGWVMSHDDEARAIGAAGRAFAEGMTFESEVALAAEGLQAWILRDAET